MARVSGDGAVFHEEEKIMHSENSPFVDVGYGLYLFVDRLYKKLLADKVADVFFFAREGQLLKEMFDFYQAQLEERARVNSHYLKVSRRSTFLLSLGPLAEEDFSVLFRQYRRISVQDFLKSLDLVEYASAFARELNVNVDVLSQVSADLPTDALFVQLRDLGLFREIYEQQRSERSAAFSAYVKSFLPSGQLPDSLHVVDVGWKGSIQDNVYHWLKRQKGSCAEVHGYYVGLISPGASNESNLKTGLLFSSVGSMTPGFHVFNENRSLYEIVLHADHGSARRYVLGGDGNASVMEDDFSEGAMIRRNVQPVSSAVMRKFKSIATSKEARERKDDGLLKLAIKRHSRMVFHPSADEVRWIFSVSHVENFGVFEESFFENSAVKIPLMSKMKFTWDLLVVRRPSHLGFWPWLTIRKHALPGFSVLYGCFRGWQSRLKKHGQ